MENCLRIGSLNLKNFQLWRCLVRGIDFLCNSWSDNSMIRSGGNEARVFGIHYTFLPLWFDKHVVREGHFSLSDFQKTSNCLYAFRTLCWCRGIFHLLDWVSKSRSCMFFFYVLILREYEQILHPSYLESQENCGVVYHRLCFWAVRIICCLLLCWSVY